jgi:hypothetical protein
MIQLKELMTAPAAQFVDVFGDVELPALVEFDSLLPEEPRIISLTWSHNAQEL